MAWDRPPDELGDLNAWCAAVGPAVAAVRPSPDTLITRLVVVSWNVHVGGGRVDRLAELLLERHRAPAGGTGFILLLQETFRAGDDVGAVPRGLDVPKAIRPRRPAEDVVRLAQQLDMSAFYVPSMRNGPSEELEAQEDRGSAILSTEPLSELMAIELPFARQRRVAVMATVTPRNPAARPLRVVATHFDVMMFGDGAVRQAKHLAQRIRTLNVPALPLVIGADANATRGFRHGTVRALAAAVPVLRQCGTGKTSAWFARSDFVFSDVPASAIAHCETLDDRYGSDHRPIVMIIDYPL